MGGAIVPELIPEEPSFDPQALLEEIVEYTTTSPENINANVLRSMLYQLLEEFGNFMAYLYNNSGESDEPFNPGDIADIDPGGAR